MLKRGIIVCVYKASEKDLLCIDSYKGITLTSMQGLVQRNERRSG